MQKLTDMNKTFSDKVRSMTAKEIIMAMVNGLRKRHTKINMMNWGSMNIDGVCFGCAATNCIIEIDGSAEYLTKTYKYGSQARHDYNEIIYYFENAIDMLRVGNILEYNHFALFSGFSKIKDIGIDLPELDNNYTEADLMQYVRLAEMQ